MTTRQIRLALGLAVLLGMVGCGQPATTPAAAPVTNPPPPVPSSVDVPLVFAPDSTGHCRGALADVNQYAVKVMWNTKVNWKITNNCPNTTTFTFDYSKACVDFGNRVKVMGRGHHLCGDATTKAINEPVTATMGDAPNYSTHLYSIRYDGSAGGDPEIDINCDTCDSGAGH